MCCNFNFSGNLYDLPLICFDAFLLLAPTLLSSVLSLPLPLPLPPPLSPSSIPLSLSYLFILLLSFFQLSFSPNTSPSSHAKIIVLLSSVLFACACLLMVCAIVGWQFGFNHFTFLISEASLLYACIFVWLISCICLLVHFG